VLAGLNGKKRQVAHIRAAARRAGLDWADASAFFGTNPDLLTRCVSCRSDPHIVRHLPIELRTDLEMTIQHNSGPSFSEDATSMLPISFIRCAGKPQERAQRNPDFSVPKAEYQHTCESVRNERWNSGV
jgi:hypothetical protein